MLLVFLLLLLLKEKADNLCEQNDHQFLFFSVGTEKFTFPSSTSFVHPLKSEIGLFISISKCMSMLDMWLYMREEIFV